mmetsp:Transcript_22772/g.49921  ORF Transcript_22772/g.49921 Transcript_22772/m.49921 type:complete len:282 (-) Transcript_22772:199-1044(-)|eukprot:CAMPEP_0118951414 /NCGR_PEP_ID=MMETSP1169-20130426/53064_1 /TAXON_ID=36882 /ORGANISM="Pyramimonas obovata, Strain CCMP722" /LENGTH=281 /DNA_ID=CAMNT_0006898465 /DNA_START=76 /DNA_END=921 /DNA_ORIENTATION=-
MGTDDLITPQEREKLESLRGVMKPETDKDSYAKRWITDACMCRYLRARNWDVKKASVMLKESLEWRRKVKPEQITWEEVNKEALTGKMYICPYPDKFGRTILMMKPGKENTKGHDGQIKHLVYVLEAALRQNQVNHKFDETPRGSGADLSPEQICLVIDYKGWSMFNAPPMKTSKETLYILQNQYPERLGVALLYDPPSLFSTLWAMLTPFMETKTANKVQFLKPKTARDQLPDYVDLSNLEKSVGGDLTYEFDFEAYGKRMNAVHALMRYEMRYSEIHAV